MDKSKLLKLFIKLFKKDMFEYLKQPFFFLGEFLLTFAECFKNLVFSIIFLLYAIFLFTIYLFRPLQIFSMAIKNKKEWATEEKYNKYFGSNRWYMY